MMPQLHVRVTTFAEGAQPFYESVMTEIQIGDDAQDILIDVSAKPENPVAGEEVTLDLYAHDYQTRPVSSVLTLKCSPRVMLELV